jgi:hypothetical protein
MSFTPSRQAEKLFDHVGRKELEPNARLDRFNPLFENANELTVTKPDRLNVVGSSRCEPTNITETHASAGTPDRLKHVNEPIVPDIKAPVGGAPGDMKSGSEKRRRAVERTGEREEVGLGDLIRVRVLVREIQAGTGKIPGEMSRQLNVERVTPLTGKSNVSK